MLGGVLRTFFRVFWATNPSKYCSSSYAINSTHLSNNLTETRAAPNQAKNNVTSRVRLDEKYAARRALLKLTNQKTQFARVCGVFLQRDARLESSLIGDTVSPETNSKKGKPSQTIKTQHHTKISSAKAQQPKPICAPSTPAHSKRGFWSACCRCRSSVPCPPARRALRRRRVQSRL
jgi:hypothetical protein